MRSLVVKRLLDLVGAGTALVVTAPLMALTAATIRLTMGTPVLFRQRRPGRGGRPFTIYKFRTMAERRRPDGTPLDDAARLGKLGAVIRSLSLDELPQLWNVVRGDMSLVGPRPLLVEYLDRYTAEQARRHEMRPGITGWQQINGRNTLTWEQKFVLDVWYVDHWSNQLDLGILLRTVKKVLVREGTSGHGHVTMPPFLGSGDRTRTT
jgi:sugar transferase EpsL